jgi:hypothetical protein
MSLQPIPWTVLPHGPLEPLAENLWYVVGKLPRMDLCRTMTVARLRDGRLLLHSAIALDEAGMAALEALGEPSFLVVPSGYHRMDAPRYKARYPNIEVLCPRGSRRRVEQVLAVDRCFEDCPRPDPGDDSVAIEYFDEGRRPEGIVLVRSADGVTAIFNDVLFNIPHSKGLFWFVYGRLLGATGGPKITPIARYFLLRGETGRGYKRWLEEAADLGEIVRLVPGHGDVVGEGACDILRQLAAGL